MSETGYKTSDGTDLMQVFNNTVITGANTFSSPANVLYGNGRNLTGLTFPNMLTTNTEQTITNIKTFAGATGGIQLSASCIQGRNDGFGFVTNPPGFAKQPLGFTIDYATGSTSLKNVFPTSGTTFVHESIPTMDAGVWYVQSSNFIQRGDAAWLPSSELFQSYSASVGGTFASYLPRNNYFSTANSNLSYFFNPLIFTATDPNGNSRIRPTTYMTYSNGGTSTGSTGARYFFLVRATKIA
jgi:hypothetical protein